MKSFKLFGSVLVSLILLTFAPPVLSAPLTSDNFDDNIKSPAWGTDMMLDTGTDVVLTEINQHLEFTGISSAGNDAVIVRPWVAGFGSYTQNWETAADVNVGSIPFSQNTGLAMFLAVVNNGDPTYGDRLMLISLKVTGK